MDTSSDSDGGGARSPGFYGRMATYTAAVTGYRDHDDPIAVKSPSSPRHSESSETGSGMDEPRAKVHHHKFSIDRILGRFGGGNSAVTSVDDSAYADTSSDLGKSYRNDLASRGAGEYGRPTGHHGSGRPWREGIGESIRVGRSGIGPRIKRIFLKGNRRQRPQIILKKRKIFFYNNYKIRNEISPIILLDRMSRKCYVIFYFF